MIARIIISRTALAAFSVVVFLVFGEILIRSAGQKDASSVVPTHRRTGVIAEFDSILGWKLVAGSKGQHETGRRTVTYEINKAGLRQQEDLSYERHSGRRRILVLGDSFTFGDGVEERERYSNILDTMEMNWEVVNMGSSGYSTVQASLWYEREGSKYNPDLVVLGYYLTNIQRNLDEEFRPHFRLENDSLIPTNLPLKRGAGGLTVSDYKKPQKKWYEFSQFISFLARGMGKVMEKSDPLPEFSENHTAWELQKTLFMRLKSKVEASGGKLMILVIPHHRYYYGTGAQLATRRPFELLTKFGLENNIRILNLLPVLEHATQAYPGGQLLIEGDSHWAPLGHRIVADSLHQFIRVNGLLGDSVSQ